MIYKNEIKYGKFFNSFTIEKMTFFKKELYIIVLIFIIEKCLYTRNILKSY